MLEGVHGKGKSMMLHLLWSMWHNAVQPFCMGEDSMEDEDFFFLMLLFTYYHIFLDCDTPHLKLVLSTGSKVLWTYNLPCTVKSGLYLENISPAPTIQSLSSVTIPFQHSQCCAAHCTSGVMTSSHLYSTADGTTGKPHHLTYYGTHSVQDYPSTKRGRREGGIENERKVHGRVVQVIGILSPPAGGLYPAWLRS